MAPAQAAPVRAGAAASAAVVGVSSVEFLDHPDGTVEYGLALREDLALAISAAPARHPAVVQPPRQLGFPGSRNSADHRAVGEAGLDAAADAGNRWIFPTADLDPHPVKRTLVWVLPQAHHAVDVTGYLDLAVESLAAHDAYLKGLGDHPMADPEFVRAMCEQTGEQAGVAAAVAIEVYGAERSDTQQALCGLPRPRRGNDQDVHTAPDPAFVFDLDGTLVDSVYQHVFAWQRALEEFDITIPIWRVHRRIGMGSDLLAAAGSAGVRTSAHRRGT